MGTKVGVLMVLIMLVGCTNTVQINPQNLASNFNSFQDPIEAKPLANAPRTQHYLYQLTSYDQAFIDGVAEFKSAHWELETNTTIIQLDHQEEIRVEQKGLKYYSLNIDWYKTRDHHDISDVSYWLTQCKWLYERLLTPNDLAEFNLICAAENYHVSVDDQQLKLSFTNHQFSEWFLQINRTETGKIKLNTGYYYK